MASLGYKILKKVEHLVREEQNLIRSQELLILQSNQPK